jgi:hypothetical protein
MRNNPREYLEYWNSECADLDVIRKGLFRTAPRLACCIFVAATSKILPLLAVPSSEPCIGLGSFEVLALFCFSFSILKILLPI